MEKACDRMVRSYANIDLQRTASAKVLEKHDSTPKKIQGKIQLCQFSYFKAMSTLYAL